jgi:polar amino acid transport system substrate-binding protein
MNIPRTYRAVLATALCLTAVLSWLASRDTSLDELRRAGTIRVGYAVEAPYAFLAPDGQVTGESPEIARQIIARLDIPRIEWRVAKFSELIPELEDGHIDVIAAGMFITAERGRRVSFSEPTFHVRQGLLVAAGNPYHLHAYSDALGQDKVRIAVLSGAIEEDLLTRMGASERQLLRVPDAQTGRMALETGEAQGLALSLPTLRWLAAGDKLGQTALAEPFTQPAGRQPSYGAFAFRHGDTQLLSAWNAAQTAVLKTPAHLALVARFGFTADEMPGTTSTAAVLAR